jgi:hypothetical protein
MSEQLNFDAKTLLAMSKAFQAVADGMTGKKTVGTVHSGILLHGPGGIFSTFGLEREVINASIQPRGLAYELPLEPSIDLDPRFASITGVTGSYGNQPDHACEDAPTAYLKGANLTSRFGLMRFDTNTIEFDKVIGRYNRGDFMDLRLLGSLLHNDEMQAGMMPSDMSQDDILNVVTLAEMLVVGVQFNRELSRQLWQGNVALTNEFPGLDSQIATGQVDADTGRLAPALDSDVKDFGWANVSGTTRNIVTLLSALLWYLEYNASEMQLDPVEWVIAMRPSLWFELSAIWPCLYLTDRCNNASGAAMAVINDQTNMTMVTEMRNSMELPINGKKYKVVLDGGIYEHTATTNPQQLIAGQFASNIYVVPKTILGGMPATTRQYLNYGAPIANANIAPFQQYRRDFWTDRGVFSWAYDGQLWCYKLGAKTEQRVVLRTPQLAGRLDHVMYEPTQHLRDWDPNSSYFADGGVSSRPDTRTGYAVWGDSRTTIIPNRW